MNKLNSRSLWSAALLTGSINAHAALITFDEPALSLTPGDVFHPLVASSFTSGGVTFDYTFSDFGGGCCWGNITYSNGTDTTTPGFTNQFSAITGDGAGSGQDNYAISYANDAYISFGQQVSLNSAAFVTTTYTYLAVVNGDDGVPGFGVEVGDIFVDAGDFLTLHVNGLDSGGGVISSLSFDLARGTSILDDWTNIDLSSLGSIYGMAFNYTGSDMTGIFIDTPTYFAVDNISYQAVPVPAASWLFLSAIGGLLGRARLSRT